MKVKNRLYISAGILIVLVTVLVSAIFIISNQITKENRRYKIVHDVHLAVSELAIITYEYLIHHEERMEQQWNLRYNSMAEIIEKAAAEEESRELTKLISVDYTTLGNLFQQVTANYKKGQKLIQEGASQGKIDNVILLEERLVAQLLIESQSIFTDAYRMENKAHSSTAKAQELARNLTLISVIIFAAIITTTSLLIARSISKPLDMLIKGTEIIGKGDLEHKVNIKSRDEMGQLAVSFDEMTSKLKESYTGLKKEITERKRAEEKIQRLNRELEHRLIEIRAANKELEAFSYSVSHDLRTPLRAIDGFSQILLEDYPDKLDREGRRVLSVIRDNTGRMGKLIEDLLALSRLGRKEIRKTKINMEKLVRGVFEELKGVTPEEKLRMKMNDLPPAGGDESLIREVLANLLSNAIKFSKNEKSPVIEVGGTLEDNENIYYVKDNGVGFDMKYRDKLFGVFQRLHSQQEFKGTGVGLAIVQRIIHRHDGRVWAEGKVNKGTTFYFTLPRKGEMTT